MKARTLLLAGLVALMGVTPAALGWGNGPMTEPSTFFDEPKYMWQEANDRALNDAQGSIQERIYFNVNVDTYASLFRNPSLDGAAVGETSENGRMRPVVLWLNGYMGYWRDCNNDGYIGSAALGSMIYPKDADLGLDEIVCPPGSKYNPGTGGNPALTLAGVHNIYELLPIGPDTREGFAKAPWSVNDTEARMWGDLGRPDTDFTPTAGITPLPKGTLDSYNGHLGYVDDLTGGLVSQQYDTLREAAGGDASGLPATVYDTPLAANDPESPISVAHKRYSQSSEDDPEGRPIVYMWDCTSPDEDPELNPRVGHTDGAIGDTVNETFKGVIIDGGELPVSNPTTNEPQETRTKVGQGCDVDNVDERGVLGDGLDPRDDVLQPQSDQANSIARKTTSTFWFRFNPPELAPDAQHWPGLVSPSFGALIAGGHSGHWSGNTNLVGAPDTRGTTWYTFYAKTDAALHSPINYPGLRTVNGQDTAPAYIYGEEACEGPNPNQNGWDCSAWPAASEAWVEKVETDEDDGDIRVVLGETYQLRDVDCTDADAASPDTMEGLKGNTNEAYGIAMSSVFDPPPQGVGPVNLAAVFTAFCA